MRGAASTICLKGRVDWIREGYKEECCRYRDRDRNDGEERESGGEMIGFGQRGRPKVEREREKREREREK